MSDITSTLRNKAGRPLLPTVGPTDEPLAVQGFKPRQSSLIGDWSTALPLEDPLYAWYPNQACLGPAHLELNPAPCPPHTGVTPLPAQCSVPPCPEAALRAVVR